ncbi:MAG: hypothetical protein OXI22_11440, partial [Defluviicoccus sp.]|nr:hypothetical protein [Defluviicoccus sp.]
AWVCGECGAAWRHWTPVCGRCEAFASLGWATPEQVRETDPAKSEARDTALVEAPAPAPAGDAAFAETRPARR